MIVLALRTAGATLIALALFHAVLWRALSWGEEIRRLTPLNARVFAVHTFFIAFVLFGLGVLSLARPDLLVTESELAKLLLVGVVIFWLARLVLQPLVFDRAMRGGWTKHIGLRIMAHLAFLAYVAVYGAALALQFGIGK